MNEQHYIDSTSLSTLLEDVRRVHPLVHCITNYVTVHDVANIVLAVGGSPMMSDCIVDAPGLTQIASALELNIGTLNPALIDAMMACGKVANDRDIPIVLDPVAAGATPLRTQAALSLAEQLRPSVIRANMSEIKALAGAGGSTRGVDASIEDSVTHENARDMAAFAAEVSTRFGSVVVCTGALDVVTDGSRAFLIENGTPYQGMITGAGCMLSATTAAFVSACPQDKLSAALAAAVLMGVAGECAEQFLRDREMLGNASFSQRMIDEHMLMTADTFVKMAKVTQLF